MVQVVRVFEHPLIVDDVPYAVQVCGRPNGNIWEGWIEFVSEDGSLLRRTPRETTQPDLDALRYWAEGLSATYLEGALARALESRVKVQPRTIAVPAFDGPAPSPRTEPVVIERAVLDPFSVAAKGPDLLRRELAALRGWHLRNIVRAYELADPAVNLEEMTEQELIELIVAAVEPV